MLLACSLQAVDLEAAEAFRPFWKPLKLEAKELSARDILAKIQQESGETIDLPDKGWAPKSISLNLREATFWQAVDEVCRLDGNLRHPLSSESSGMVAAPWRANPTFFLGPFRFTIEDVARVREFRYPDRSDYTEVTLLVQWTSSFTPALDPWPNPGRIEVVSAVDEGGRSLLPQVDAGGTFLRSPDGTSQRSSRWILRLQPVGKTVKAIGRLDLTWKTVRPDSITPINFDNPMGSEGMTRRVGPFTLTLERCARDPRGGAGLETTLVLRIDKSEVTPELGRDLLEVPLDRRVLNWVKVDGVSRHRPFRSVVDPKDPNKAIFKTYLSEQVPRTISIHVATGISSLSVPLRFNGIRLPEDGR